MEKEVGGSSVRTWSPNDFLKQVLGDLLDRGQLKNKGVAVDFGCGSGRDLVYMADMLPGWRVIGLDNHSFALDRAMELAKREKLDERVEVRVVGLRKRACLGNLKADFVHGSRFLHRPLIKEIRDSVLGGEGCEIFVWSTFLTGKENLAPPRKPSRGLMRGELRGLFETHGFNVLRDEESHFMTRGFPVPASLFAAQRTSLPRRT